ncbi:hypothetical protein [Pontibacter chitinilyticus]|uniref:hypothetical protein n=1 Tax=Pontibacter chitinilyticus TaxID=2674989 RepID=UPI00321BAA97
MRTKLLMSASAGVMALTGIGLTFLPDEILGYFDVSPTALLPLILQVLGALYFAFAMLNWMAKGNLIGGIYSRPVAIANVTHFVVGGLALLKGAVANPGFTSLWVAGAVYSLFAILFSSVLFRHPLKNGDSR